MSRYYRNYNHINYLEQSKEFEKKAKEFEDQAKKYSSLAIDMLHLIKNNFESMIIKDSNHKLLIQNF